jgi:hypothetical protein
MSELIEFPKLILGKDLFEIIKETCRDSEFGLASSSHFYYHHCPRTWLAHKDYSEGKLRKYRIYNLDLSLGIGFSAIIDNKFQDNITVKSLIGAMVYNEAKVQNMPELHQNDYYRFMDKFHEKLKNHN